MRFLLAFVLSFVSVFAAAQTAPPMVLGGPQGINVTKALVTNWLSVPNYIDTPVSNPGPLPWPGRGYIIQVVKTRDTSLWQYTGQRWSRIAGVSQETFTKLLTGGDVNQVGTSRQYTVSPSTYYINGVFYTLNNLTTVTSASKTANANGRIDVITLATSGVEIVQGTETPVPLRPSVGANRIELAAIYYRPFDTVPKDAGNGITSVYRIPGRDSLYFTSRDTVFAIRDSIGVAPSDTAAMLNAYKFTAANGLTKDSTVFRLGGSLNQNTNINLNTRRLTIIGGNDTTRFFSNGSVSIGGTPDSTYTFYANGNRNRIGNLEIVRGGLSAITGVGINVPSIDGRFEFQGSGIPQTMFEFKNWAGDTIQSNLTNTDRGIIRIYGGFRNPNITNLSGNVLWITPRYRFDSLRAGTKVRGIYYNPSLFSAPAGIDHIAYENATGSNILNSTSGNTRIGYNTSDTTYKLDVNGRSRITSELTVGSQDRSSALAPFANIFSDKEIISEDGFIVQSPNALGRIKTGMDAQSNILRFWAGNANIVSMDYVGGGVNRSNLLINDTHNGGAGATGNVNTLTVAGNLLGNGLNSTVHNQINIVPAINDTFGIGLFRGVFYNPIITYTGYDISLKHTAFQNTIGNNLLNSTSGNTRIGYNTNDTTFKLDVNGDARVTRLLVNTTTVDTSAAVNIVSTTKGFLQPRMMNTERNDIATPATGLQIFSTTDSANYVYRGTGGGWQKIANEISGSATLDFLSTGHGESSDLTFTVTGATEGDVVALGIPNSAIVANSTFTAWVSAANTITVRFNNYASSGNSDPGLGVFKIKVFK